MNTQDDNLFIQRICATAGKVATMVGKSATSLPEAVEPRIEAIIFDGDDTLWHTQAVYDEAKEKFYRLMADQGFGQMTSGQGFNKQAVASKLAEIVPAFVYEDATISFCWTQVVVT